MRCTLMLILGLTAAVHILGLSLLISAMHQYDGVPGASFLVGLGSAEVPHTCHL